MSTSHLMHLNLELDSLANLLFLSVANRKGPNKRLPKVSSTRPTSRVTEGDGYEQFFWRANETPMELPRRRNRTLLFLFFSCYGSDLGRHDCRHCP